VEQEVMSSIVTIIVILAAIATIFAIVIVSQQSMFTSEKQYYKQFGKVNIGFVQPTYRYSNGECNVSFTGLNISVPTGELLLVPVLSFGYNSQQLGGRIMRQPGFTRIAANASIISELSFSISCPTIHPPDSQFGRLLFWEWTNCIDDAFQDDGGSHAPTGVGDLYFGPDPNSGVMTERSITDLIANCSSQYVGTMDFTATFRG